MEHPISDVKMNGIPLIPPLVTSDIAIEIQYYKQLAVAVQERLKALEIAQKAFLMKNQDNTKDNRRIAFQKSSESFKSEINNDVNDKVSNTISVMDYPTNDKTESLIDFSSSSSDNTRMGNSNENVNNVQKHDSSVPEESFTSNDKSSMNSTFVADGDTSDTITASTDLNQFLNTSMSTETTEIIPESWKPQVPKTLDIVPITVDKSKSLDESNSVEEETPKLVRQGSYVLDAPSPMLLAHMQNEMANTKYVPTSTQSIKCREWNMSQLKGEWKTQSHYKGPTSIRSNVVSKSRRNNNANIPSQRLSKSVSNSKTGSPLEIYQLAKSVDCIPAMFAKECYSSKTARSKVSNQNLRYSSLNGQNGIRNNSSKKTSKATSIINLANKMSGSLGSLSNSSPKPIRSSDRKNGTNSSKISNENSVKIIDKSTTSNKAEPAITSEKIVTVFKEIQDTHKKQMIELITRQQKEQLLMQENFKKQEILVLAQIRKAFPEMSISALSEALSGKNMNRTATPLSSKIDQQNFKGEKNNPQLNGIHPVDKVQVKSSVEHSSKELSSTSCHLTIQPTTPTVVTYYQNRVDPIFDDSSPMLIGRPQTSNIRDIDDVPVGNPIRRHSSVSRQLFPLDSKTTHVPVFENSMYTDKHIKAAITITAYAKGFLVRRLMKTEKMIALKNTYREALHCMLKLHVDAPLNLSELNFHQRLQLQCDAASMNIVDLFSASPIKRMEIIAHDREIKKARSERPSSARSYSFATQRTLARKKLKEMGVYPSLQSSVMSKSCPTRTRCQSWTSNTKERKTTTSMIYQGIKRSTSAGAVRKPWR